MSNAKPKDHLDLLALDSLRAGEGTPDEKAHLEACGACRGALEDLERLSSKLAGLREGFGGVPGERDRAILDMARRELGRAKVRKLVRPRLWWSAAAAALLLAAGLGLWVVPARRLPLLARLDPADIDRSGSVDILDAYTLAIRIRAGAPLDPSWDLNHDGVVDRKDADVVAKESVSLRRRTE